MKPHTELAIILALLGEALEDPDANIAREISSLSQNALLAVPSYLGMTVIVPTSSNQVEITVPPVPWAQSPLTSIRITLTPPPAADTLIEPVIVAVTLYAATPGAFVDLGADVAFMFKLPLSDVVLDRHLPGPVRTAQDPATDNPAFITVSQMSLVNQAIGVLIGQGCEPDDARHTLINDALTTGTTLGAAAARVIAAAQRQSAG